MKINILLLVTSVALVACGGGSDESGAQDISGKVMTVNGPMIPDQLGITLPHEHIFIDFVAPDHIVPVPTDITVIHETPAGQIKNPNALTSYPDSLAEVTRYKDFGGKTIVDVSDFGLTRDPTALKKISDESGLNVVMGAGLYQRALHPRDIDKVTVEQLTKIIVDDLTVGVQGTSIRAGIIGEIGIGVLNFKDFTLSDSLTENEIKSVIASARASRLTGAPMSFHTFVTERVMHQVMDMVEKEGVDLSHVILGHTGGKGNTDVLARLIDRGVYIEWDYVAQAEGSFALRMKAKDLSDAIVALASRGEKYAKRILLSHDICTQEQLYMNQGGGFAFSLEKVVPLLKNQVTQDVIDDVIKNNPQRALTFTKPQKLMR
jgi:phosphotriesterase-related protein